MSLRHLVPFLRRAATAIHAGIDVRRFWEMESQRAPSRYRDAFQSIYDKVSVGDTLAEAMEAQGDFFPVMVREMVDVGEKSGRLEQVLHRLAEHYTHLTKLKRTFLAGITWPLIQLGAALFIVGFLIWFLGEVLPAMGGRPVDILGFGMVGNSGLLKYLGILLSIAILLFMVYAAIRRRILGDLPLRFILRIPYLGTTLETMALARLTWTLAMCLESGVDAKRSMKQSLRSSHVPHFVVLSRQVDEDLTAGHEFHVALRNTGEFSDEFLNMLETAEISGSLSESMLRLSEEYSQRAEAATNTLITFATFGIWGMVATFIVILIFRLAMFYIGILQGALRDAQGF